MPIRREHRDRYAENWRELAAEIKAANLYVCQCCDQECLMPDDERGALTRAERARRTLTIAHQDSVYDAPAVVLLCICAPCHLRYDATHHAAARRRQRRVRRRQAGQMVLIAQREPRLTAYELAELEAAWPGHAYLETLEDGIDLFAEYPIAGGQP
jgi:hypothetical protein